MPRDKRAVHDRNQDMTSSKPLLASASLAALMLLHFGGTDMAQAAASGAATTLPSIEVDTPRKKQPSRRPRAHVASQRRREATPA